MPGFICDKKFHTVLCRPSTHHTLATPLRLRDDVPHIGMMEENNTKKSNRNYKCGPMPNVMAALPNIGGAVQRRKVWLTPTTRVPCSNAAKMRNPLKFAGCPKHANRSQPLVSRSSPYYQDMWRRHYCLTSFFLRLSIHASIPKI